MRNARSPENPTTSANTGALDFIDTTHCEPTGARMPLASRTIPVKRVKVPLSSKSLPATTRWRA
jgi:hypothetical protein